MKTVMFNPYTGTPRHPSDIASDPEGLLILEPGAPLRAATQWRSAYSECAAACDAIAEQYGDGRGGHAALRCANVIRAIASAHGISAEGEKT